LRQTASFLFKFFNKLAWLTRIFRAICGLELVGKLLQLMIRAYQLLLSPFLGNHCRFTPSCSHYAAEAIGKHGTLRGSWLAIKRISRCHPFCEGGHDPVP